MSEPFDDAIDPLELPRLRIHHLLALTAVFSLVTAVNAGLMRLRLSSLGVEASGLSNGMSAFLILNGLLISVCIAILLFGHAWRKRGLTFPSQPGHWVAMYLTLAFAFDFVEGFLPLAMVPDHVDLIVFVLKAMGFVFHSLAAYLWIVAYRSEPTRIWKWGWAVMALRSLLAVSLCLLYLGSKCIEWLLETVWFNSSFFLLPLGPSIGLWMLMLSNYACAVFFVAATISDFRHNRRRHWSHWLVLALAFIPIVIHGIYYHLYLIEGKPVLFL